jgi:NitT/TauT family transport system ATP-binding protein
MLSAHNHPAPRRSPLFCLQQVTKRYSGEDGLITAVQDLDLSVYEGEFVSIIGPSGCGKTTILNLMAGLERSSEGAVMFHQSPVHGVPRAIGYVFQEPTLLPWRTIFHNVALPLEIGNGRITPSAVDSALQAVGLGDFSHEYPGSLSVGMRQKVAIARALVHDPEVLLMDEPFSSLDSISREQLNFQLLELWERMRKTIVFVTHSISEAILLSDRILLIKERPGSLQLEVGVDIPRPRTKASIQSPQFARLLGRVHRALAGVTGE